MTTLDERLRTAARNQTEFTPDQHICWQAADRIAELEAQGVQEKSMLVIAYEQGKSESADRIAELQAQKSDAYKEVEIQTRKKLELQAQIEVVKKRIEYKGYMTVEEFTALLESK